MPWRSPFYQRGEPEQLLDQVDAVFGPEPERGEMAPVRRPRLPRAPSLPPTTLWEFFVRGWRLLIGWMMGLVAVRIVVVPFVQLARREPVEPIDITAVAAILAVIWVSRTYERTHGGFT